jgi:hypothetical protein
VLLQAIRAIRFSRSGFSPGCRAWFRALDLVRVWRHADATNQSGPRALGLHAYTTSQYLKHAYTTSQYLKHAYTTSQHLKPLGLHTYTTSQYLKPNTSLRIRLVLGSSLI